MQQQFDIRGRWRAACLHLLISAGVAFVTATLVFGLWFPGMYRHLAGGRNLFLLVVGVDVVLGPLLTFAVFNKKKGWSHLRRDLAVIGVLQLAGLIYGVHVVFEARPVAMVFEVDRFRIVSAAQVYAEELPKAPPPYRQLPLTGPWLLGTREPTAGEEKNNALFMSALGGIERGQRPAFWQPYADSKTTVQARAKPLEALLKAYPKQASDLRRELHERQIDEGRATFLPLITRSGDWVVILDGAIQPVHFAPVSGFF